MSMNLSREHRTAILVALAMAALLTYVVFFRDGTSW
jgi:hypothetical protein